MFYRHFMLKNTFVFLGFNADMSEYIFRFSIKTTNNKANLLCLAVCLFSANISKIKITPELPSLRPLFLTTCQFVKNT